jgi:hypothetical protein
MPSEIVLFWVTQKASSIRLSRKVNGSLPSAALA